MKKCDGCGGETRTRCGRCRKIWYCGKPCQQAKWPEHKLVCTPAATNDAKDAKDGKDGKDQKPLELVKASVLYLYRDAACNHLPFRFWNGDTKVDDAVEMSLGHTFLDISQNGSDEEQHFDITQPDDKMRAAIAGVDNRVAIRVLGEIDRPRQLPFQTVTIPVDISEAMLSLWKRPAAEQMQFDCDRFLDHISDKAALSTRERTVARIAARRFHGGYARKVQ